MGKLKQAKPCPIQRIKRMAEIRELCNGQWNPYYYRRTAIEQLNKENRSRGNLSQDS
jgi:hypothetical protein